MDYTSFLTIILLISNHSFANISPNKIITSITTPAPATYYMPSREQWTSYYQGHNISTGPQDTELASAQATFNAVAADYSSRGLATVSNLTLRSSNGNTRWYQFDMQVTNGPFQSGPYNDPIVVSMHLVCNDGSEPLWYPADQVDACPMSTI